ncbi:unnamed protein product, partial [Caenorhabditis brenneri]
MYADVLCCIERGAERSLRRQIYVIKKAALRTASRYCQAAAQRKRASCDRVFHLRDIGGVPYNVPS